MRRRLKVLVSAYACAPGEGSEPGVGWNWLKQIARYHDVWVITRANNREKIEHALRDERLSNIHPTYFDLPKMLRFWKKGQRGIHVYYYMWQIGVFFVAFRLHRQVHIDLAHHITFGVCWLPSLISLLPVPFVWGPVGGVEASPKEFLKTLRLRNRLTEKLKELAKIWGWIEPFVALTRKRAVVILAQTKRTVEYFPKLHQKKAVVFPAVGFHTAEIKVQERSRRSGNGLRIVSMGRLLYFKGFDIGLRAFARLLYEVPRSEYMIIGDGIERRHLVRLAAQIGISEKVIFCGMLQRNEALELLGESDIFLHPSFRDPPVYVIVEAMAYGLPVVCLDTGGPAMQVTEETGIKVPAFTPPQAIDQLAQALIKLAREPELRAQMGSAGRIRVKEYFDWNVKGDWIQRLYEERILSRHDSGPREVHEYSLSR